MRNRSIAGLRRLTDGEFPILPFLAPRVFAPWPAENPQCEERRSPWSQASRLHVRGVCHIHPSALGCCPVETCQFSSSGATAVVEGGRTGYGACTQRTQVHGWRKQNIRRSELEHAGVEGRLLGRQGSEYEGWALYHRKPCRTATDATLQSPRSGTCVRALGSARPAPKAGRQAFRHNSGRSRCFTSEALQREEEAQLPDLPAPQNASEANRKRKRLVLRCQTIIPRPGHAEFDVKDSRDQDLDATDPGIAIDKHDQDGIVVAQGSELGVEANHSTWQPTVTYTLPAKHHEQVVTRRNVTAKFERHAHFVRLPHVTSTDLWAVAINKIQTMRLSHSPKALQYDVGTSEHTEDWLESLLDLGFLASEDSSKVWQTIDSEARQRMMPHIMLWLLMNAPQLALRALIAFDADIRDDQVRADIVKTAHIGMFADQYKFVATVTEAHLCSFDTILRSWPGIRPRLSQDALYYLIIHCNMPQLAKLLDILTAHAIRLKFETNLHIVYAHARFGHYHSAMSRLKSAKAGRTSDSFLRKLSKSTTSTCCKILRCRPDIGTDREANIGMLSAFQELGIEPTTEMYNIVIMNALDAKDVEGAVKVCNMMQEAGQPFNAHTFGFLLRASAGRLDPNTLSRQLQDVEQHNAKYLENSYIGWGFAYCFYMYYMSASERSHHVFGKLAVVYKEFFDSTPLIELGIFPDQLSDHEPRKALIKPPSAVIGLMMTAYLMDNQAASPQSTQNLYKRFQHFVHNGHPIIAPLAESDYVYNSFLKLFGQHRGSLPLCPQIIRDMTAELPPTAIHQEYERKIRPMFPTAQTFNILLHAFTQHEQFIAADRVLKVMKSRGVQPNTVTWNTLLAGFARSQKLDRAVETLEEMRDGGHQPDRYTEAALLRLNSLGDLLKKVSMNTAEPGAAKESLDGKDSEINAIDIRLAAGTEQSITEEEESDDGVLEEHRLPEVSSNTKPVVAEADESVQTPLAASSAGDLSTATKTQHNPRKQSSPEVITAPGMPDTKGQLVIERNDGLQALLAASAARESARVFEGRRSPGHWSSTKDTRFSARP